MFINNAPLRQAATAITLGQKNSGIGIKLRLFQDSTSGVVYEYTPHIIDSLTVDRDFTKNFTNDIVISFQITMGVYRKIYQLSRHLLGELCFYETTADTGLTKTDVPPVKTVYQAILLTPGNLSSVTDNTKDESDAQFSISVMLISKVVLTGKNKSLNTILHKATVDQALTLVAKVLGFTKIYMDPPENPRVYDNLIIPPGSTLRDVFTYIQEKYGVYSGGITAYIDDDVLYIFPPYTANQNRYIGKKQVDIYSAGQLEHTGTPTTYKWTDPILQILVTGQKTMLDPSQTHAENVGTAVMYRDSSLILDPFDHTSTSSRYRDDVTTIGFKDKGHATGKMVSIQYAGMTDNPLRERELLVRDAANFLMFEWQNSKPELINPGQPVTYKFDDDGTTKTYQGHIDRVMTTYTNVKVTGSNITVVSALSGIRVRFPK